MVLAETALAVIPETDLLETSDEKKMDHQEEMIEEVLEEIKMMEVGDETTMVMAMPEKRGLKGLPIRNLLNLNLMPNQKKQWTKMVGRI